MSMNYTRLNESLSYSQHILLGLSCYISRFFSSVIIVFVHFCKIRNKFPDFVRNRLMPNTLRHFNLKGIILLSYFACCIIYSYYELSSDFSHFKIVSSKLNTTAFSFCHLYMFVFLRYLPKVSTISFKPEFIWSTKKNPLKSPMVKYQIH